MNSMLKYLVTIVVLAGNFQLSEVSHSVKYVCAFLDCFSTIPTWLWWAVVLKQSSRSRDDHLFPMYLWKFFTEPTIFDLIIYFWYCIFLHFFRDVFLCSWCGEIKREDFQHQAVLVRRVFEDFHYQEVNLWATVWLFWGRMLLFYWKPKDPFI